MLSIVRSGGEPAGVESFIILTNGISLGAKASTEPVGPWIGNVVIGT